MNTKLAALRARMKTTDTDLVVLGPGAHQKWLIGFHTYPDERPCFMFIGQEKEVFVMPELNADEAKNKAPFHYEVWRDADGPQNAIESALRLVSPSGGIKRYALDETMRTDFSFLLMRHLVNSEACLTNDTIGLLRMCKSQDEYLLLKQNALIADEAVRRAMAAVRVGVTENHLAAIVRDTFSKAGAETLFTMVASGPNGALPHYESGDRVLQDGDVVIIDIGGTRDGYCSDITRVAVVGEPPSDFAFVYETVERAVQAALRVAKPGVRAKDVDIAARNVIRDAGFGEYFLHRTGHGLGSEVHEQPFITGSSETILEEGMVFSIEPGIYLHNKYGIRLEEIVILRKDVPEIFSEIPRHYVNCTA